MTELHVVTLLASATEIVCAFGDGDRHQDTDLCVSLGSWFSPGSAPPLARPLADKRPSL